MAKKKITKKALKQFTLDQFYSASTTLDSSYFRDDNPSVVTSQIGRMRVLRRLMEEFHL